MICLGWALALTLSAPPALKPVVTFKGLGDLPEGAFDSKAYAISADGKTVVGTGTAKLGQEGFVWTEKGGIKSIGVLLQVSHVSEARSVSSDGSVVVGYSNDLGGPVAVKWTEKDGLASLGRPAGAKSSYANAATRSGDLIVGEAGVNRVALSYNTAEVKKDGDRIWVEGGTANQEVLLATTIGWTKRNGSDPAVLNTGKPSFEFTYSLTIEGPPMLPSRVEYHLGNAVLGKQIWYDGPRDYIECHALGDVTVTGVSENGAVLCGTIVSRVYGSENRVTGLPTEDFPDTMRLHKQIAAFIYEGGEMSPIEAGVNTSETVRDAACATAISRDGSTVVGYMLQRGSGQCWAVWRLKEILGRGGAPQPDVDEHTVEQDVQAVKPMPSGTAWAVSDGGDVVVGDSVDTAGLPDPSFYTRRSKAVSIAKFLKRHCPKDVAGWTLVSVRGVSRDGKTIVGWGKNPQGAVEAWIATIGDVNRPVKDLFPSNDKSDEPDDDV